MEVDANLLVFLFVVVLFHFFFVFVVVILCPWKMESDQNNIIELKTINQSIIFVRLWRCIFSPIEIIISASSVDREFPQTI